ncbi:MAG: glycosyltransferase family 39 protein [Chloroflexota bacterium]|nr:glycosyltransferase family 39 protein [Chloroflexota bacterium]
MPPRATLWRDLAMLTVVALAVRSLAAWLVPFPPHVDAAYYTMVGEQLAIGNGFTAPAIWSFLEVGGRLPSEPRLPVPSNGHWMPLPAIVAAAGMSIFGPDWRAGQVPMVLLSTALVPMTYVGGILGWRSRRTAMLGALLAIPAGPLLLMYPLVESFAVFGVVGGAALLSSLRAVDAERPGLWLVLAGAFVGLAALTRIDGVILALAPATVWMLRRPWAMTGRDRTSALAWGFASATAFAVILSPWLLRNLDVFGTAFPSPGGRLLWIRDYNEHLSISLDLTVSRYLEWGPVPILASKLNALVEVVGRSLGLFGGQFGLTFVAGLWRYGRERRHLPFTVYFGVMFLAMVLLFTEHAPKGAYLHTAPAWLPIALPMAVAGVGPLASGAGRWWRFLRRPATHRFLEVAGLIGAVVLAVAGALTLLLQWDVRLDRHQAAARYLAAEATSSDVLLSADPSSLFLLTGLRGVPTSFDPYAVIGEVVEAYGVDWVVVTLDGDATVDPLGLWNGSSAVDVTGASPAFLPDEPAFEVDGVRIYEVRADAE